MAFNKKKTAAVGIAAVMALGALAGCDLVSTDLQKDYEQVIAEVDITASDDFQAGGKYAAYADAIVNIPLNPKHCSLNLAQAVLLAGYEIFRLSDATADKFLSMPNTEPANKAETEHLFDHLEQELEVAGYFKSPEKRPRMMRNLRNIFMRADLTSQDVRTLHGVIADLAHR